MTSPTARPRDSRGPATAPDSAPEATDTDAAEHARPHLPPSSTSQRARSAAILVALLLTIVALAAALGGPWERTVTADPSNVPQVQEDEEIPDNSQVSPPPFDTEQAPPDNVGLRTVIAVIVALLVLAGAVALVVAVRRVFRDGVPPWLARRKDPPVASLDDTGAVLLAVDHEALTEAIDQGIGYLDAQDLSTADAVIAAWVGLEQAAESSGTARRPAQTPTEFTVEILETTPASPEAVATLLRLYHRARFTEHPLDAEASSQAREVLSTILSDLTDVAATAEATAPPAAPAQPSRTAP